MKKYITKYKGLAVKELQVAYVSIAKERLRAANKVANEMERHLDMEDLPSKKDEKTLEKLQSAMNECQVELDAIGMLKTGRF